MPFRSQPDVYAGNCWQVWFDGSALPNPGRIGLGIVIVSPDGRRMEHALAPGLHGCNNQAELHALCAALELAHAAGAQQLLLRGDSDVAIAHVKGSSSTQIATLVPLIEVARNWLSRFDQIELQWVPRHRNAEADRLCRQALGLAQKEAKPDNRRKNRKRR
ncbi:MAG TPA: ribonuclease HI family protein [Gallionellaceae bacterium]